MTPTSDSNRAAVQAGFDSCIFVGHLGIVLLDCGPGWCEAELPLRPEHLQHSGVAHAGVIATLADQCAGGAAMTQLDKSVLLVTAEFKINLLRAGKGERLLCRGTVLKPGRNLFVCESEVFAIDKGQRVLAAKLMATLAVVHSASS
ncbi:uncharacterized protein (TIGR00369 family) [Panacagrimonas perspica]|uniref:Medium/long-chain acyl-CoA thioesterase YigI n=1 Tax=Panacagrimonas perspica TaxID=381431 RepID=A0A4R7P3Y4_9GAMM|nr:PaaI family thioesterase [Panacagrimonas perspica]TDU28328.1 uncharacterized protein (TIGR00369 family) [Panacagrimonas perspica]THD02448.1 phenylacetic acid degradation protein PaaI [Panacagrimonas perspica]